jgi:hypothetical protein
MSDERRARVEAEANRVLPPEEFEAALATPSTPEEEEQRLELIRWFVRRYPTPAARLKYARRAASRIWRPR